MIPAENGRNAMPAFSGPIAEHALDVERVEEEHREHARHREEHRDVRGQERADAEDREPDERRLRAQLDHERTRPADTAASPKNPSVFAEPQPACCASTMAYTSAISPPVTVTAPARS